MSFPTVFIGLLLCGSPFNLRVGLSDSFFVSILHEELEDLLGILIIPEMHTVKVRLHTHIHLKKVQWGLCNQDDFDDVISNVRTIKC